MESRIMEMMMSMQRCSDASRTLYDELKNNTRLNSVIVFEPHSGYDCFRAKFSNPIGEVHGISISYPSDVYQNKFGQPTIIEIALVNAEGDLCFVNELGYYNVCRFDSASEIVEEILRISSTIS